MPEFRKLKELDLWLRPQPAKNATERDEAVGPDTLLPKEETKPVGENEAFWEFHEDELYYTCSHCGCSALNDCFGQSTDSKFCPTCGKLMINSTIEED